MKAAKGNKFFALTATIGINTELGAGTNLHQLHVLLVFVETRCAAEFRTLEDRSHINHILTDLESFDLIRTFIHNVEDKHIFTLTAS